MSAYRCIGSVSAAREGGPKVPRPRAGSVRPQGSRPPGLTVLRRPTSRTGALRPGLPEGPASRGSFDPGGRSRERPSCQGVRPLRPSIPAGVEGRLAGGAAGHGGPGEGQPSPESVPGGQGGAGPLTGCCPTRQHPVISAGTRSGREPRRRRRRASGWRPGARPGAPAGGSWRAYEAFLRATPAPGADHEQGDRPGARLALRRRGNAAAQPPHFRKPRHSVQSRRASKRGTLFVGP